MGAAIARHDELIDSRFAVFSRASDAVAAA